MNLSPIEPKSKYAVLLIFRQGGVTYNTENKWTEKESNTTSSSVISVVCLTVFTEVASI